jgi:hypothetical protein
MQKDGQGAVSYSYEKRNSTRMTVMKSLRYGKFYPDDFDAHEDAFLNLLAQSFGVLKEPLCYIKRSATEPTEFVSNK